MSGGGWWGGVCRCYYYIPCPWCWVVEYLEVVNINICVYTIRVSSCRFVFAWCKCVIRSISVIPAAVCNLIDIRSGVVQVDDIARIV